MRLTLGPLQYFWPRERVLAFYREAAGWPLDVIYLGENVCSKRRELAHRATGSRSPTSSPTAGARSCSPRSRCSRRSRSSPRCAGWWRTAAAASRPTTWPRCSCCASAACASSAARRSTSTTTRRCACCCEDGLERLVLGVEHGRDAGRASSAPAAWPLPELEVAVWGRLPLSYSARCFTARALDLAKDDCGFRCIDYPDGLPLASRDGQPFLTINGISVQTRRPLRPRARAARTCAAAGISLARIYPQAEGTGGGRRALSRRTSRPASRRRGSARRTATGTARRACVSSDRDQASVPR